MAAARESVKDESDRDTIFSILDAHENYYDDLRVAARNLALVGLVVRLHHWAAAYARRIDGGRTADKPLETELGFLNSKLGKPPVPTEFFRKLVDVRDSVIHANSLPQWTYRDKPRLVDARFAPEGYRVAVSDEDLAEALEKAITLIKWYDERLIAISK